MAYPNSPMPSGAGFALSPPDAQRLVALLGSLVPLLLSVQAATSAPVGPFAAQAPQFPASMSQDPMIDHEAAVTFVQDMAADSLRTLSSYMEANAGRHGGLDSCVATVTQAARCYAARDYGQAFALIWQVYRQVTALRHADPQLPPLHTVGDTAGQFGAATFMTH